MYQLTIIKDDYKRVYKFHSKAMAEKTYNKCRLHCVCELVKI